MSINRDQKGLEYAVGIEPAVGTSRSALATNLKLIENYRRYVGCRMLLLQRHWIKGPSEPICQCMCVMYVYV